MLINLILPLLAFIGAVRASPNEFASKMMDYREKCVAMSGSDEGYQQAANSMPSIKACFLSRFDMQELETDMYQFESGNRRPFLDKYCPKVNESMNCLDDTLEGIAKCMGDEVKVKAILKNVTQNLLDFVCRNDNISFFDAVSPGYQECITQIQCSLSETTKKTTISKYGEEQCRDLDQTRKCIQKKVAGCDAAGLIDLFKIVFNTISEANDCQQYTLVDENNSNNSDENSSENRS